jgi:hypothetical protein
MSFLRKLFGYRTKRSASGLLDRVRLMNIAAGAVTAFQYQGIAAELATVANTNSMLPTFDENAALILEGCRFDELTEGDIVTRRISADSPFTVHRLNERTASGWWHLGDNNARVDSDLVTEQNFHRRVCAVFYGKRTAATDL